MTDKCWFLLRHSHYSPPTVPEGGIGKAKGPLCIGHVIPSPKLLDIINPLGPEEYPIGMPIYDGRVYDLKWKLNISSGIDLSADVAVPIAAAVGLTVETNAGIAFKKTVNQFWEFERLDTYHVNITQSYLDDTADSDEVLRYMATHKTLGILTPSVFVVTGIMVARAAKVRGLDSSEHGVNAGEEVDVPEFVRVSANLDIQAKRKFAYSHRAKDFIFAIRVAKVSKGMMDGQWSYETLTKGSTFAAGEDLEQRKKSIKVNLAEVGLGQSDIIGLDQAEDIFIWPGDADDELQHTGQGVQPV